jgi:hypothetical protein
LAARIFTEANKGNEAEIHLCFLRYLLFKRNPCSTVVEVLLAGPQELKTLKSDLPPNAAVPAV